MPINRWVDKENVVYTCSGLLFIFKKGGNPAIYHNTEEAQGYVK